MDLAVTKIAISSTWHSAFSWLELAFCDWL